MNTKQVMERNVLHAGKVFIKENEEHSRAYIVQSGKVRSFKIVNDMKVHLKEYGPNTILGERNLLEDRISEQSYEAVTDTTVICISRHDFEKRLQKSDSIIQTVFQHMMAKVEKLQHDKEADRIKSLDVEEGAFTLVRDMIKDVSEDQKRRYELAMLPHVNALVKSVQKLKTESS